MSFFNKLEQILEKWKDTHPNSFLIQTKFDKSKLVEMTSEDSIERIIIELLKTFCGPEYKFKHPALEKLNSIIQHHCSTTYPTYHSDCKMKILEHSSDSIRFEFCYGYWYYCVSQYIFDIKSESFKPISFNYASYNGRGGHDEEIFDSDSERLTIEQVFNQIVERFQ